MKPFAILIVAALGLSGYTCRAQQTTSEIPDSPTVQAIKPAGPLYSPPTQGERFKSYLKHTYWIGTILEAGARAGIEQARDNPSQWPQGGQGYAERFGSVMGEIAIRGTTEYLVADMFKEDLRFIPCRSACSDSAFKRALADTFTARKGDDGHRAFSVARLVAPVSGSAVAIETWYPSGLGRAEIARHVGLSYGFSFIRNYLREVSAH